MLTLAGTVSHVILILTAGSAVTRYLVLRAVDTLPSEIGNTNQMNAPKNAV